MKMLSIFLLVFFVCWVQPLQAEPMFIEFTQMMQQTQTIVIADFLGVANPDAIIHSQYRLLVKKVLKGNVLVEKELIVDRAHGEIHFPINTPCIAFLNTENQFEWVATASEGKDLLKDALFLRGFYDFNAYMVSPSGVSLRQLEEYLQTGSFNFAVAGYLNFYDPNTQTMKPSNIYFEANTTYPNGKQHIKVEGLELGDFNHLTPSLDLPGYQNEGSLFSIVYEPNMVRPLKFCGQLQNYDEAKQRYNAFFWVTDPDEMTPELFETFIKSPQYGHPYYEIKIQTSKGKNYLFTYHQERGRIGALTGFDDTPWVCSSLGDPSDKEHGDMVFGYYKPEKLIIRINPLKKMVNYYDYPYRQDRLIRVLRVQPLQGQVILKDTQGVEKVLDDCIISLEKTLWAKNVNYKK